MLILGLLFSGAGIGVIISYIVVVIAEQKYYKRNEEDAISRQAVDEIKELMTDINGDTVYAVRMSDIRQLSSINPQPKEQQESCREFAKWVASEIFDELWEYNKEGFDELACRKLAKLGIVRAEGDEWELVESEEEDAT